MRCQEYEDYFQLYIDDELTAQERSTFEEHLGSCSTCKQRLNSLLHMTSLVGGMREYRVPVNFNYGVLKELGFALIPRWSRVVSAVATVAVGGWVGLVAIWAGRSAPGNLPGFVKFVLQLPGHLGLIAKVLDPIVVLLKAGALVLRSLGGFYMFTTLSLGFLVTVFIWWLVNQRLRPVKVLSLI